MKSRSTLGFALLVLAAVACAHQEPDDINTPEDMEDQGGSVSAGKGSGGSSSIPFAGTTSTSSGSSQGGTSSLPPVGSSGGKGGKGGTGGGGKASGGTGGSGGSSAGGDDGGTVNMPLVGLSVEFKPADSGENVAWLGGELSVINETAQPLTVADLKIRYYFTDDMAGAPNPVMTTMNWAQCGPMTNLGGATCEGKIVALTPAKPTANTYVEITCQSSSTPELSAGTLLKASWKAGANGNSATQYQKDDHSFMKVENIVVLNGSTIVWGVEP